MKLIIERNRLLIVTEEFNSSQQALDLAYIEEVLGLKQEGDSVRATRVAVMGLPSTLVYIEIKVK